MSGIDTSSILVWWDLQNVKSPLSRGSFAQTGKRVATDTGEPTSLRTLLLSGDFYVAAVTASAMTKMVRIRP